MSNIEHLLMQLIEAINTRFDVLESRIAATEQAVAHVADEIPELIIKEVTNLDLKDQIQTAIELHDFETDIKDVLRNYDFENDIQDALQNYDFENDIQDVLRNYDFETDIQDVLREFPLDEVVERVLGSSTIKEKLDEQILQTIKFATQEVELELKDVREIVSNNGDTLIALSHSIKIIQDGLDKMKPELIPGHLIEQNVQNALCGMMMVHHDDGTLTFTHI